MSKDGPTSFRYADGGVRKPRPGLGWLFRLNRLLWGEDVALRTASDDEWVLVLRIRLLREAAQAHARLRARVMGAIEHMAQDGLPAEQMKRDWPGHGR